MMVPTSAVVITLDLKYGPTRLAKFQSQWEKTGCVLPLKVHKGVTRAAPSLGCFHSHYDVWNSFDEPVLIFEDDAVFSPEFSIDVAYPEDIDLFYFGGQHERPPVPVSDGIVRAVTIHHTHAYVVRDPRGLAEKVGEPKGNIVGALNNRGLIIYAASPFTVGQAAGPSFIQSRSRPQDEFWNE